MTLEPFRTGKAVLDRFLAPFVYRPACCCQSMGINLLLVLFPNVTKDALDHLRAAAAVSEERTGLAKVWIGEILPIALPVRGPVGQPLTARTAVAILFDIVDIVAFVKTPFDMVGSAVANDLVEVSVFQIGTVM